MTREIDVFDFHKAFEEQFEKELGKKYHALEKEFDKKYKVLEKEIEKLKKKVCDLEWYAIWERS